MYNPDALTQALQTGVTAEKTLLDSLRGPDAAQRITDEQISNVVKSVLFAPRYKDHENLGPVTRETWKKSSYSTRMTRRTKS